MFLLLLSPHVPPSKIVRILRLSDWTIVKQSLPGLYHRLLKSFLFMFALIWVFAGVMLTLEYPYRVNYPNVQGAAFVCWHDAIYFAVVSLTTVGYGDLKPLQTSARLITSLMIVFGVGIFGSQISKITGMLQHLPKFKSSYVK